VLLIGGVETLPWKIALVEVEKCVSWKFHIIAALLHLGGYQPLSSKSQAYCTLTHNQMTFVAMSRFPVLNLLLHPSIASSAFAQIRLSLPPARLIASARVWLSLPLFRPPPFVFHYSTILEALSHKSPLQLQSR